MTLSKKFLLLFCSSALLLLLVSSPALAKSYEFKKWDIDIEVARESTFVVTERITYDFHGEYSGASRTIDLADNIIDITDFSVSEGDKVFERGTVRKGEVNPPDLFDVMDEGRAKQVNYSFRAIDEEKTLAIKYKVIGGFNYLQSYDELIWRAIAEQRNISIEEVVVTVHLPKEVELASDKSGLNTDAADGTKKQTDPKTVRFTGTALGANTKFRVGLKLPKGVITPNQTLLERQREHAAAAGRVRIALPVTICVSFFLVLGVFLIMLLLWYRLGRDLDVPKVADYLTEPPGPTRPAVVGEILKEGVGIEEINATLIDLGRRGYLRIRQEKDDTIFEHVADKGDLNPYEEELIEAVFGGQKAVYLSSLKNAFYRNVPRLNKFVGDEAVREGYFKASPSAVRKKYTVAGLLLAILGGLLTLCVIGSVAGDIAGPDGLAAQLLVGFPVGAVILSGLTILAFGYFMPRRTPVGAEARAKWEAFREYLKDIKKFGKLERAQEIFENFLPYAVAFGLERVFTNAFADEEIAPPIWFFPYPIGTDTASAAGSGGGSVSPGGFSLDQMSDSLFSMLDSTADTLLSSPSGSSGGSDFGGDFGGGAGGGGGSDAW